MMEAVEARREDYIQKLMQRKALINLQNKEGDTALMIAARMNSGEKCVKTLLRYSPNLTLKNVAGKTALAIAQESRHEESVLFIRAQRDNGASGTKSAIPAGGSGSAERPGTSKSFLSNKTGTAKGAPTTRR
jgi:ankyrin repeat protein